MPEFNPIIGLLCGLVGLSIVIQLYGQYAILKSLSTIYRAIKVGRND